LEQAVREITKVGRQNHEFPKSEQQLGWGISLVPLLSGACTMKGLISI
jgi:hypothetical protein